MKVDMTPLNPEQWLNNGSANACVPFFDLFHCLLNNGHDCDSAFSWILAYSYIMPVSTNSETIVDLVCIKSDIALSEIHHDLPVWIRAIGRLRAIKGRQSTVQAMATLFSDGNNG